MRKLVEAVLENLSSKEVFLFRVTCGSCGLEYGNRPIRFSKADAAPATRSEQIIYDALYEQEFKGARYIAIRNAAEHVNFCPICKRLVCNQCFLICDDLDMCSQCAKDLEQQGSPVGTEFLERNSVIELPDAETYCEKNGSYNNELCGSGSRYPISVNL